MNKKIWAFGDSYTQLLESIPGLYDFRFKYTEYKGRKPLVFTDHLSFDYGYECINRGHGGSDNYTILDSIINHLSKIKDGDIIIIGWSSVERTRLTNKLGKFTTLHPHWQDNHKKSSCELIGISVNAVEEILGNRHEGGAYIGELNRLIKLLNYSFKNNILINWSPFSNFFPLLNVIPLPKLIETISEETKGKIQDSHFSENGHKVISENLHNYICNLQKII